MGGCKHPQPTALPESSSSPAARISTTLIVDFKGRGEIVNLSVDVPADTTVFGVLAKGLAGEVLHRGDADRLFVMSIRGIANEGASGDNWTYRVNGELGKVSAGVCPVADGDKIEWTFGKYSPE